MLRYIMTLTVGAGLAGLPLLGGCERELAHEREVEIRDGTVREEERRVTEQPDGTIKEVERETVDRPN